MCGCLLVLAPGCEHGGAVYKLYKLYVKVSKIIMRPVVVIVFEDVCTKS